MTAGEEEDKAVHCADPGSGTKPLVHSLARAARAMHAPCVHAPKYLHGHAEILLLAHHLVSVRTGVKKKRERLTRDQPSMFKKSRRILTQPLTPYLHTCLIKNYGCSKPNH